MQKKSKYEKNTLLVMALLAIAGSGYLIYLANGFNDTLVQKSVTARNETEAVPLQSVQDSVSLLTKVFNWTSPVVNNKPVPLNKSILVILKGDTLVDLYVAEPKLRDPITNEFLVKNHIPNYLFPNVGELDPDGDGFTNLEEFTKNTDPMNPASHPPFTDHLYFARRSADDYIITLKSYFDPYLVVRTAPSRDSQYIQPPLPKPFGFKDPITRQINERFVAESFEPKTRPDGKNVSELTVTDRATNSKIVLVYGVEVNLADYYAEFEFWQKEITPIKVKKGSQFRIPGVAATFKLLEVEETQAVIVGLKADGTEGEKLVIKTR